MNPYQREVIQQLFQSIQASSDKLSSRATPEDLSNLRTAYRRILNGVLGTDAASMVQIHLTFEQGHLLCRYTGPVEIMIQLEADGIVPRTVPYLQGEENPTMAKSPKGSLATSAAPSKTTTAGKTGGKPLFGGKKGKK